MPYKYLILLLFLWNIHLYSNNIFCKKEFYINILPFLWDTNTTFEENQDLLFLNTGIPKMIYSNIKTQFYVDGIKVPLVKIQTKENPFECKNYTLVKIQLIENMSFILISDLDITKQLLNLSLKNQYDGILIGILSKKEQHIHIHIIYLNSYDSKDKFESFYKISSDKPYNENNQRVYSKIANDVLNYIQKRNQKKYRIESTVNTYKVYVNEISYGTNINEIQLPEGNFKIQIFSEQCKKELFTENLKNSIIRYDCNFIQYHKIFIQSEPENSLVFIDETFYGNTPLQVELPEKIYRVRISKEGYIDKFILIDLINQKQKDLFTKLEKGNNTFYYKKRHFISNWTYYDMSFGLALQSLIFAGGWAYSNIQKEKALDSIRSPIIQNYFYNPLELSLFQLSIIENARKKSLYWHRQSQIYGGLGALSLILSGYFLYKGIQIDLTKVYEYGSISFRFRWDF